MESRWCDSRTPEAGIQVDFFCLSELLRKAECYNQIFGEESYGNSLELLLPEAACSSASTTNGLYHGYPSGMPTGRYLKKPKMPSVARQYLSQSRSINTANRSKKRRIDNPPIRCSSHTKSEFSDSETRYCLNSVVCDNSKCEIPPCSEPGCDGDEIIVCNYGEDCTAPAACTEDCFGSQITAQSVSSQRYWPLNEVKKAENPKQLQNYTNPFQSYMATPISPSPTTPLLSNDSTIYSPKAELPTPKGPFSPGNSYQDLSENSYGNTKSYLGQSTRSASCNEFDQSWNNSDQYSCRQNSFSSFQCPWLDCSRLIETSEQWNEHFHQEHIDPQLAYTCPLHTESCSSFMASNSLAHLESEHGFDFSLNNQNGYRCPSESCQQSMELFNNISFHDHLDVAHATPSAGQLQCRLWACGNWFDDPNKLVSHAMQNHRIPVWSKPADEQTSTPEPNLLSYHIENQNQKENNLATEIVAEEGKKNKKDFHQKLSQKLQESKIPDSNINSMTKLTSEAGVDKYSAHKCLWKDLCGIVCDTKCGSENELQNHIKESHLESLDNKTGYFCRWDGCIRESKLGSKAGFTQRGKLERHMATHTNFKCSTCDICGVSFSAPQAMRQHRRLHTGERPWKCRHCNKTFTQQSACTVHERTHTNEKPLECPICFKRFSESSNLTKHRKTHGEKGAHVCTYSRCGKTFHRYDQLKRHLLSHTNCSKLVVDNNRQLIIENSKKRKIK
ncbi:Zinc finger protein 672 [Erysiphe neolycopersici]|uniref:Zinc finger protein 672 n=1 Tax=Erysiphe neolycopersici TaxID=212602 RepID=A0A420I872_9PEZI|nr:Zinc finger protein 672 [Erysiphe neolycopersici]